MRSSTSSDSGARTRSPYEPTAAQKAAAQRPRSNAPLSTTQRERQYKRDPKGTSTGGQFTKDPGGAKRTEPGRRRQGNSRPTTKTKRAGKARAGGGGSQTKPKTTGRTPSMELGADNDPARVKELQRLLRAMGFSTAINGVFGGRTERAVKELQRKLGMRESGKASTALVNKLKAAKALCSSRGTEAALDWLAAEMTRENQEATVPTTEDLDWARAVEAHVRDVAPRHGADPAELLDSLGFFSQLDHVAEADADDPELLRAVEAAVEAYAEPDEDEEEGDDEEDEEDEEPEKATESVVDVRLAGRVLEAKGTDAGGGRVYRVRMLKYGESKNRRRYSEAVMRRSAHLYEGAPAFDRHRTPAELQSSTTQGLIGQYRNISAETDGLYGDLHLLPGALHAAEALDASLAAQQQGLPPLVGVSHDVRATFRPVMGGRGVTECAAIEKVQSTDLVTDPSAGGAAVRVLAGGTDPYEPITESTEEDDEVTTESVLAAFSQATDEQLAAAGLTRTGTTTKRATEATRTTEAGEPKDGFLGKMLIRAKVEDAFPSTTVKAVTEAVTTALPDRITESDVDSQIAAYKALLAPMEAAGLTPTVTTTVVKESRDKVIEGLDKFFADDFSVFRSFKQAHAAYHGNRPRQWGEDENRTIFRESFTVGYDSWTRTTESMDTTTWAQALGDSVTRRMLQAYKDDNLNTWRQIARSVPTNDFRTQRLARVGSYGTLPVVAEGGPYNPLTSPGDEEATFALTKKGGTEDVTLEMVANDDVRALSRIPGRLGRAAVRTLYEAVFGILSGNPTATYDSVALFHSSHANTDTSSALSQTTLSVGRRKMIEQAAYGDASEILGTIPKYLIVPPELEELAFQLTRSAVAIPATPAGPSDAPNIHNASGLTPILVPSFTDANDWFISSDPAELCNIEVGFYQGREMPELFTQNDPSVGSAFNNDTTTWKIRHIWKEVVTDHRGLYRGVG